ncbi:MAG: anhydro-N-acetylmuramic acid kinase [Candidatus Eisenbacteria bacterium]|nr:anhydro-N-acetylmuramic acid kinase [Candidatus Eisenbacteria bacterium]
MTRDALATLRSYRTAPEHLVVGLMTGTSADAVDAVLVRLSGEGLAARHEVLAELERPLADDLRDEVLAVAGAKTLEPERLMRLDTELAEVYAEAVSDVCEQAGVARGALSAIGSHGQTVRHIPRSAGGGRAFTLQLGSPATLAERTGVTVVSDFRRRDTAAGGEGAPLVPIADYWLFRSDTESRVLLNLGGMANITWLPKHAKLTDVLAFDTGPGNAVLDGLVRAGTRGLARHDEAGGLAASGRVHDALLEELLADPFFTLPPPRSTGRERFGESYAERLADVGENMGLTLEDTLATAVELTAGSIERAIADYVTPRGKVDAVYVSGGGVRNVTLMMALRRRLSGMKVERLDTLGVSSGIKEALAFAFLAHLTLCGEAGNVPGATGARHPAVLGSITPGGLA